ncbi:transmembrane protein 88a [Engraulis encrasicolus]|uniref:transmembrane protein 88a n=1 Tax=Engraulis encrasicolus TaxID=184585 RepID=UPI002FD1B4EB
MSLSRNGTLDKSLTQLGNSDLEHTRLHHTNSLSSSTVPPSTGNAVVVPPPYSSMAGNGVASGAGGGTRAGSVAGGLDDLELRSSLDCWACSVLVTMQNLVIASINGMLASVIFGLIMLPALVMLVFGFLCHSSVQPHGTSVYCSDLLNDEGCVALLVVGFLLMTPLLVLALAAYCRLARHLQLGLCFIPYSRAVYKNLPASQHRSLACCGGQSAGDREGKGSVWV